MQKVTIRGGGGVASFSGGTPPQPAIVFHIALCRPASKGKRSWGKTETQGLKTRQREKWGKGQERCSPATGAARCDATLLRQQSSLSLYPSTHWSTPLRPSAPPCFHLCPSVCLYLSLSLLLYARNKNSFSSHRPSQSRGLSQVSLDMSAPIFFLSIR